MGRRCVIVESAAAWKRWTIVLAALVAGCCEPHAAVEAATASAATVAADAPNCPSQFQPQLSCPPAAQPSLTQCCKGQYESMCIGPDDHCCTAYPHGVARCNSTDSCCSGGARASASAFCCEKETVCCSGSKYEDGGRCCQPTDSCCPAQSDNGLGTCCKKGTSCCSAVEGGSSLCCTADQTCVPFTAGHYGPTCANKTSSL